MPKRHPLDHINQRRRQMHVHSIIYYHLHTSIIDDATFDKWAVELANLQKKHPEYRHQGYRPVMFESWTGDTGMHLVITDDALDIAERLLKRAEKESWTTTPVQSKTRQKASTGLAEEDWQGDVGYKPEG